MGTHNSPHLASVVSDESALDAVRGFLKGNNLPADDLRLDGSLFISYTNEQGELIGSGGLEFYSGHALMRSIAVRASERNGSVGNQIVKDLIQRAKGKSVDRIFLLTETAHDFFARRGFTDVSREFVPLEVRSSSEFTTACPASAACMFLDLKGI